MSKKKTKWEYPSTKGWANFPFSVDGVDFISALDKKGNIYPQAKKVPAEVFQAMNIGAIRETIGDVATMTRDELIKQLYRVNEGATQALILLA
mgnify:CR=1 FL=1